MVFAIGFWATGALPEPLTALLFLLAAVITKVAPPQVVFAGFYSSAVWLVYGGIVLGVAVKKTGLGRRTAQGLLVYCGSTYTGVISGVVLLAVLFAFVIPSTLGRMVLLVPVVAAMAERLGFSQGRPGYDGIVMAAILACFVPSCAVLPANVPNMVTAGAAESLYDLPFSYGYYLKLHFPVIGLLKSLAIIALARVLFPDRIRDTSSPGELKINQPFTPQERRLTIILAATLLLWLSDFVHGVSPAWVALAAALVCLLPVVGIFPEGAFSREINIGPFFYVAGVLGLGAVVGHSGLGDILGRQLTGLIDFAPDRDFHNFVSLVTVATALGPVTTAPGVPAVLAPLSAELAAATGFPLGTVLMTQVIGFSTPLLPYQVAPVVVGMQLGRVSGAKGARMTLALAVVSLSVLMPVNYLWWALLGVFERAPF